MTDQLADTFQALDCADHATRHTAALRVLDFAEAAVATLFRAINRPENINHRGTQLFALMAFKCSEHFAELFSLALCRSYEVQCQALSILREQRFSPTLLEFDEASRKLDDFQREFAHIENHQSLCNELRDVLARENPAGNRF